MKTLQNRLDRLEQRAAPKVIALRWVNADWDDEGEKDPNNVWVADERMPVAEFHQRYPTGTLINIEYTDDGSDSPMI